MYESRGFNGATSGSTVDALLQRLSAMEINRGDIQALQQGRKFKFLLYRELEPESRKEWLVSQFLGSGEASAFYGVPGCGKSVLVEDLGLHVAAGREWLGRKVKPGAVLYVALERKKLVERRAIAFRNRHRLNDLPFAIIGGVHDFRQPKSVADLVNVITEIEAETGQDVVLIIIDTLSRAMHGGDENSPKDMGAIVAAVSRLMAKTKAAVLFVHHMPQDGQGRLRGHGALLGAMDTTVHVEKLTGEARSATVVKANDSEEGEHLTFRLESVVIGRDDDAQETTAPVVVATDYALPHADKTGRLTKAAQIALRALSEAVLEQGSSAPPSDKIPPHATVVSVATWREQAYRRGISTGEERGKQQAFKRASEYLIAAGRVGFLDGQVWLTG